MKAPRARPTHSTFLAAAALLAATPATAARTATVTWTAPGDDGMVGRATRYELRYSQLPITPANFASALLVPSLPAPRPAGSRESLQVGGLPDVATLYLAVRTVDEAGNWSGLSNVAILRSSPLTTSTPPAGVTFGPATPNPARSATRFVVGLPASGAVRVEVFDADGRRVRTLVDGPYDPGLWVVPWDLRDQLARRLPPGVYLVRALVAGTAILHRVIVLD